MAFNITCHVMSCHVIEHVMSCHMSHVSCYVMLCYVMLKNCVYRTTSNICYPGKGTLRR